MAKQEIVWVDEVEGEIYDSKEEAEEADAKKPLMARFRWDEAEKMVQLLQKLQEEPDLAKLASNYLEKHKAARELRAKRFKEKYPHGVEGK